MEINRKILDQVALIGFDIRAAERQILANENCAAVSAYHLLYERMYGEPQGMATSVTPVQPPMAHSVSSPAKTVNIQPVPSFPEVSMRPRTRSAIVNKMEFPANPPPNTPTAPPTANGSSTPSSPLVNSSKPGTPPPSRLSESQPIPTPPSPPALSLDERPLNMSHESPVIREMMKRPQTMDHVQMASKRFSLPTNFAREPPQQQQTQSRPTTPNSPAANGTSLHGSPRKTSSRILSNLFRKKSKSVVPGSPNVPVVPPQNGSPTPGSPVLHPHSAPNSAPGSPEKERADKPGMRRLPSLTGSYFGRKGKTEKIRSIKGVFNVDTTTMKAPREIVEEVQRVLSDQPLSIENDGYIFRCKHTSTTDANKAKLQFEVEVCQIKGLAMNGVKFKRVAGDVWEYRNMCQLLMAGMKL